MIDDLFASEASAKDRVTLTNTVGSDSITIQNQYSNPQLQSKGMDAVGNIWAPVIGLSAMDLIYSDNHKQNADHTEEESNVSPQIFQAGCMAEEEETLVPETQMEDMPKEHNEVPQERTHLQEDKLPSTPLRIEHVVEETVFKDIQISPIRNLDASFEGVKDSGGDLILSESEGELSDNPVGEDDMGLLAIGGVSDKRTLEMTLAQNATVKIGESKKRGPKSNRVRLEIAGNAAGQSKLRLRLGRDVVSSWNQ